LGAGGDTTAIHDNVAGEIFIITEKVTPVAGDIVIMEDSAAGYAKKRLQLGNAYATVLTTNAPTSIAIGDVAAIGTGTKAAKDDHKHGVAAPGAPADVTKSAASAGASATFARADHKHDATTAAAITITDASNSEGAATSLSRSDHGHAHGSRGGGSLHAVAVASVSAGFISAADQAKLDSVVAGGGLRQTAMTEITVDTTTASVAFVTLISTNITITAGGVLLVNFSAGTSNTNNNVTNYFRLVVNGVNRRSGAYTSSGAGNPGEVTLLGRFTGLPAGVIPVVIQWRVGAGTAQVRPVAAPDAEHAVLVLTETSV
jgi:hypothetical protein